MVIIDEISFAKKEDFEKIENHLRILKENKFENYGGVNVVFSGDLRQLEPVKANAIYEVECPQFTEMVDSYIELQGMHRFKNDPEWGFTLQRFRNGNVTKQDIDILNSAYVVENDTIILPGIKYATYTNEDRDSINTATLEEHVLRTATTSNGILQHNHAVVVLADRLQLKEGNKLLKYQNCMQVWQECGEADIIMSKGKWILL